jgi:hypothetical protein
MNNLYKIPDEYNFRIHHVRPRFKNDVENVLFYMAKEISNLDEQPYKSFKEKLNQVIRQFPGNSKKELKTINNWRTEISALFGLIQYTDDQARPSQIAKNLADNEDLIEFFRYFLYFFQYPGGHLKPNESLKLIEQNIKFKPAKFIIHVLWAGKKITQKEFGISQAECTHCIFNDLRVTTGKRSPEEVANLIIENRSKNLEYDSSGDVVRYAGDILDYMALADLATLKQNYKYYLNNHQMEALKSIAENDGYFKPYEILYNNKSIDVQEISNLTNAWFDYTNSSINTSIFKTDILAMLEESAVLGNTSETESNQFILEILDRLRNESKKPKNTKEIGDVGESIVIEHEKNRLVNIDQSFKKMLHWIKKLPEQFAMGYDIQSLEGVGDKRRYIEVKTTLSMGKLSSTNFHMTPSEWSAASSLNHAYFIYRLMISKEHISLFVIQDPVGKYKNNLLDMIPRDGADIKYSEASGNYEKLHA